MLWELPAWTVPVRSLCQLCRNVISRVDTKRRACNDMIGIEIHDNPTRGAPLSVDRYLGHIFIHAVLENTLRRTSLSEYEKT